MEDEKYFVGIDDYQAVRRNLLECSKSMIYSLRRFSAIQGIRAEKKSKLEEIRGHMKELSLLFIKLKDYLPKEIKQEPKKRPIVGSDKKKGYSQKTAELELDNLEKELNDIETKLSTLKK